MTRTRIASFLGVLALAAWFSAAAPAQESYQTVAFEGENADSGELQGEVSELRTKMNASASAGYEGGCGGCGAPVGDAGCGCGGVGCDACGGGCGCEEPPCGTWGCFEPCCHPTGFWGELELMFFKYHRAGGVDEIAPGQNDDHAAEFGYDETARITVGYVRCDGLGVRARYWHYDHDSSTSVTTTALANQYYISVETYNLDVEVFDTFCLNRNWDIEVGFGIRWNEFTEDFQPATANINNRFNYFSGWGGVASIELRRCIGESGALFVRARHAILMSDADYNDQNGPAANRESQDVNHEVTELAIGYQYTVPICGGGYYFLKTQAEWQNWANYDRTGLFGQTDASDVGFGGFGVSAGIAR